MDVMQHSGRWSTSTQFGLNTAYVGPSDSQQYTVQVLSKSSYCLTLQVIGEAQAPYPQYAYGTLVGQEYTAKPRVVSLYPQLHRQVLTAKEQAPSKSPEVFKTCVEVFGG